MAAGSTTGPGQTKGGERRRGDSVQGGGVGADSAKTNRPSRKPTSPAGCEAFPRPSSLCLLLHFSVFTAASVGLAQGQPPPTPQTELNTTSVCGWTPFSQTRFIRSLHFVASSEPRRRFDFFNREVFF